MTPTQITNSLVPEELDTYDAIPREEKETIDEAAIQLHWKLRSKRPSVQAVMSARHSLEENLTATEALQQDIFEFLNGYVEGKRVFELGYGIGRMTKSLAKHAAGVVGCDIIPEMQEQARRALQQYYNVELYIGRITDFSLPPNSFDIVFDSIVLLHILDPKELEKTARKMQELSDRIFIVEHTYEGEDFPISKYSILRKPEEYIALFQPYHVVKQKTHFCVGDRFTMILFEK